MISAGIGLMISAINMVMIGKVTITEIAIFCNIGPILTVFIGKLCMENEKVSLNALIKVCVSFTGVVMMIVGKKKTVEQTEEPDFAH